LESIRHMNTNSKYYSNTNSQNLKTQIRIHSKYKESLIITDPD
jgi:hypothetical protein